MAWRTRLVLGVGLGFLASACGSSNGNPNSPGSTTLAISGTATVTAVGQTSQLAATATQGSSTTTVTSQATWTSSSASVATVSSSGLVTAQGFGSATITAAYQGVTQTFAFAVSMSGTWTDANSSGGEIASVSLVLSESGANVTGTMTFNPGLPNGQSFSTDTITGTMSGSTFTWTLTLTPGADPNEPSCVGVPFVLTGTGQINGAGTSMVLTALTASGVCDKNSPSGSIDANLANNQATFTKG